MINSLIHIIAKIFKVLIYISITIVLFIVACGSSMLILSYLSIENYSDSESPHRFFRVVLETYDDSLHQMRFACFKWDDFKEMQAKDQNIYTNVENLTCGDRSSYLETGYSASLSVQDGSCYNISSDFKVENIGFEKQKVTLRWAEESFKVQNEYYVVDNKVKPLHFRKFLSDDIAILGFLLGFTFTLIIIIAFRFYMRRYKKLRAKTQRALPAES